MRENENDKRVPLVHVRTRGRRATSPERIVAVQTNTPASQNTRAQPAKLTRVVSSPAGAPGSKPVKRIGAADVEKVLGATAMAALERMRPQR